MSITPSQVNVAVNGWVDSVQAFLSGLGTNPVTELLEGALLLVRRSLFNQTPTARSYECAKRADGELLGAINVIDPEGARVTYRLSEAPEFGTASIDANGNWAYTPGQDFVSDRFTVTVDDGGFNIFDPAAGSRTVIVRVGDTASAVQGFGDIPLYIQNDTGMALVNGYWGPRYQGSYNGLLSGRPDNFVLQPGDSVAYESEAHFLSSGEAYEVVMSW